MMLDITPGDVLLWHFWQGRIARQEKEKRRMAQVIHDSFSPHLLAAFFLMNGIQERLEKVRPEEAKRLVKATQLLNESIQNLASGVAETPPQLGPEDGAIALRPNEFFDLSDGRLTSYHRDREGERGS